MAASTGEASDVGLAGRAEVKRKAADGVAARPHGPRPPALMTAAAAGATAAGSASRTQQVWGDTADLERGAPVAEPAEEAGRPTTPDAARGVAADGAPAADGAAAVGGAAAAVGSAEAPDLEASLPPPPTHTAEEIPGAGRPIGALPPPIDDASAGVRREEATEASAEAAAGAAAVGSTAAAAAASVEAPCDVAGVEAADGDSGASAGASVSPRVTPRASNRPRSPAAMWTTRSLKLCSGFVLFVLALYVLISVWPRNPVWSVSSFRADPQVAKEILRVYKDPSFNGSRTFPINVTASAQNRNHFDLDVGAGHFVVTLGNAQIGEIESSPLVIAAAQWADVPAAVTWSIGPEAVQSAQRTGSTKISAIITGSVPIRCLGIVKATLSPTCKVDVDLALLDKCPDDMVEVGQCSWSFRF